MNPIATSKANILKPSRELIQQNGWAGVNIRSVAAACGVSVVTISIKKKINGRLQLICIWIVMRHLNRYCYIGRCW